MSGWQERRAARAAAGAAWTALAVAGLVAGCGPAPRPEPLPRFDAKPLHAAHPAGRLIVEFPGYLEPGAATERAWLHLVYKAPDAWFSIVFLRDCLEPGPDARPCPEVEGCAFVPGTTALLSLGRERGRLLEVVRARFFWNTRPRLCARASLRVATRRPEFAALTALLRELPIRIRVTHVQSPVPATLPAE